MHLVLLGDSIFDNAVYVPGRPAVIEQVRAALPGSWQATLLAIDGNVTIDVERQLTKLPADATHLAVSVGGNDALGSSWILREEAQSVAGALDRLAEVTQEFRNDYREMLRRAVHTGRAVIVCTIYDAIPGLARAEKLALAAFNDVILLQAFAAGVPVVDLRLICTQPDDYSSLSPIEPSHWGGAKIAAQLARAATTHDFGARRTSVFAE